MVNDEQFYAAVADEIARGHIDKVLWTKAFANSGGEETATKSLYCRLRAEQLQSAARQQHRNVQFAFTKAHAKQLGFGLLAFVIGLALTGVSYSAAKPGGHYFFTYGLIVGGFVSICKGLSGLLRSQFMRPPPPPPFQKDSYSHSAGSQTAQDTASANPTTQQTTASTSLLLSTQPPAKSKGSGNISTPFGCLILAVAVIVIVIVFGSTNSDSPTPASTTYTAPEPPKPPQPSLADRRAAIEKTLSDLDTEYRALSARRLALDLNNANQLAAFTRDAEDYNRRVQVARDEEARLDRQ